MISTVAIIGAGDLGGALAYKLASRDRFAEIRLIDDNADLAAGKALDVQQAGAVVQFRTRLSGTADLARAASAGIIVLADAATAPAAEQSPEWHGDSGLAMLERLSASAPEAVFVCAGASQRQLIEMAVFERGVPRRRLVGSAPLALAASIRALVALEADGSPADVSLTVLGIPPAAIVVPWSDATIAGSSAHRILTPPQFRRIEARVARLWPPGAHALASAAARVCEAVAGYTRRTYPCFVALDGEFGTRRRAASLPVALGPQGVERIGTPPLSVQERVKLENALGRQG